MNVYFKNPVFIYFLPVIFLPLIIYLLFRRKYKVVYFPWIYLIEKSIKRKVKWRRFEEILLLILRILTFLLIILFFSSPVIHKKFHFKKIYVDISYSMQRVKNWDEVLKILKQVSDSIIFVGKKIYPSYRFTFDILNTSLLPESCVVFTDLNNSLSSDKKVILPEIENPRSLINDVGLNSCAFRPFDSFGLYVKVKNNSSKRLREKIIFITDKGTFEDSFSIVPFGEYKYRYRMGGGFSDVYIVVRLGGGGWGREREIFVPCVHKYKIELRGKIGIFREFVKYALGYPWQIVDKHGDIIIWFGYFKDSISLYPDKCHIVFCDDGIEVLGNKIMEIFDRTVDNIELFKAFYVEGAGFIKTEKGEIIGSFDKNLKIAKIGFMPLPSYSDLIFSFYFPYLLNKILLKFNDKILPFNIVEIPAEELNLERKPFGGTIINFKDLEGFYIDFSKVCFWVVFILIVIEGFYFYFKYRGYK